MKYAIRPIRADNKGVAQTIDGRSEDLAGNYEI